MLQSDITPEIGVPQDLNQALQIGILLLSAHLADFGFDLTHDCIGG